MQHHRRILKLIFIRFKINRMLYKNSLHIYKIRTKQENKIHFQGKFSRIVNNNLKISKTVTSSHILKNSE